MLVSSTINPSARSPVHLVVVNYENDRVLVPVDSYAKYADLQDFAVREWALAGQQILFETDELDICAGKRVRIHEWTWPGVKDIVGNVHVRIRSSVVVQKLKHEVKSEEIAIIRDPSESADEAEVEQQTKPEIHKSEYEDVISKDVSGNKDTKVNGIEHQPSASRSPKKPAGDALNLFNDEVAAYDANEEEQLGGMQADRSKTASNGSAARTSTWKQILLGSGRRDAPDNGPKSAITANSGTTLATATPASRSAESVTTSNDKAAQGTDKADSADPERVLIVVEPPPDNIYEARGFRIRREHSVRTVLKGACKAFKIDYTKAILRMVIEEEDGEELTAIKCNDTDTMNSLKVTENQRFMIEILDDGNEGESDG